MNGSYISQQFNGPIINGVATAIENVFSNNQAKVIDYLSTLNIDTAKELHLEMIGKLVGFVRPIVNEQLVYDNLFRFTTFVEKPSTTGFSLGKEQPGGLFAKLVYTGSKLPLESYRKILKIICRYKYSNEGLLLIDSIANSWVTNYKIQYIEFNDLSVLVSGSTPYTLYLLQTIYDTLYTLPRIQVVDTKEIL